MPSHQDRVRRNYHSIRLIELEDIMTGTQILNIRITKADIASRMSLKAIRRMILEMVDNEIKLGYKE